MTGIYGVISSRITDKKCFDEYLFKEAEGKHLQCQHFSNGLLAKISLDKFRKEKIFQKVDGSLVSLEGVILNLKRLMNGKNTRDLGALIRKLYTENPDFFPLKLTGSFQGFMYSERENKLILFTDHIGSMPIFYLYDEVDGAFIFGSDFKVVNMMMGAIGYSPRLNVEAAYCLLTFGHMLGDLTLVEGVRRLPPGSILTYDDGELSIKQYYKLSSQPPISDTEEEAEHRIANIFARAVYAEYAKDLEYNYPHLATLSGGLDSRTNIAFAKKLGFSNITCFTYSQSNYLDEKIAKKIAHENNMDLIFFPLDYGNHLIQYMDDVINLNGGLVNYIGICNLYPWLRKLPLEKYGLLHTGILGGEIFGEYVDYSPYRKYDSLRYFLHGWGSGKLLSHISHLIDKELSRFDNPELFKFYNVGVNAQFMNMHIINNFIDAMSPYLFPDLLEYVMRMQKEYKLNKKIYVKMINIYTPEFAKYKWEHYRIPPKYPLYLLRGYCAMMSFYTKFISRFSPCYSMNPFEYWYKRNSILRKSLTLAFTDNIDALKNCNKLRNDCEYLFKEGDFPEKTTAITLLRALKLLQINCQEDE